MKLKCEAAPTIMELTSFLAKQFSLLFLGCLAGPVATQPCCITLPVKHTFLTSGVYVFISVSTSHMEYLILLTFVWFTISGV